jgi:hypothetical protein
MFLTKKPCRVPHVLDIVDCPAYNYEHEMLYYPKFYDPLYYPELCPEIFATVDMVKQWLEFSLTSHVTVCGVCLAVSLCFISHIKFSVWWGEHSYIISSYVDGKFRQCVPSLEELQSCRYSHCKLVSRLYHTVCVPMKDYHINPTILPVTMCTI